MTDLLLLLPNDIILNIIARLSAKPLQRLRCVSRYWNHMLMDPNFMKLRSLKTIMLFVRNNLYFIGDDVPNDNMSSSIVEQCCPYENLLKYTVPAIIGAFNGIILLRYDYILVFYNPFTRVSKKLPDPPNTDSVCVYGFGYGVNSDDLKVIAFRGNSKVCDVYDVKKSLWTTLEFNISIKFQHNVGTFTNGFLYWIAFYGNVLIVLDVENMQLSTTKLPFKKYLNSRLLGTRNGCLCALHQINATGFDVWVMKDHNQWSKMYSFKSPVNDISYKPLFVFDSGTILMVSLSSMILFIYNPWKDVYKTLNISVTHTSLRTMHVFNYVETLVSPLDMCSSRLKEKQKKATFEEPESSKTHSSDFL